MVNTDFHNIVGPYTVKELAKFINAKTLNLIIVDIICIDSLLEI